MTFQFGVGFGQYVHQFQPLQAGSGQPAVGADPAAAGQAPGAAQLPAPSGGEGRSGHVVNNPTNATAQNGQALTNYGAGGFSAFAVAQPMMLSPVMFQFGFPMAFALVAVPLAGFGAQPAAGAGAAGASEAPPPPQPAELEAPPITESSASPPDSSVADDAGDAASEVTDSAQTAPPAAGGTDDIIDVVPPAAEFGAKPKLLIESMNAEDFERYQQRAMTGSLETRLNLELKTRDGDVISLDFRQLDARAQEAFRGVTLDGGPVRSNREQELFERVVNMTVEGELSPEERGAIDGVLAAMVEVAQSFVAGDLDSAVAKLKAMDFDSTTLADLSLQMSMTRSVEVSRAYRGDASALDRVAERDGEVQQLLEFMADGQKRLVDMAKDVLDPSSAVRLVKNLLPPMLAEPVTALMEEVGQLPTQAADAEDELAA